MATYCSLKPKISLNGGQLKAVAFLSMLIDHINKAVIGPRLTGEGPMLTVTLVLDVLGRIAFPLFAFMIVEGFFKTSSRKKYLRNLLIFAAVSEIPYDLFQSLELFNFRSQNILWGLALSLVLLMIVDKLKETIPNKPVWLLLSFGMALLASLLSMGISSDYEEKAILVIFILYLFYNRRPVGALCAYLVHIKDIFSALGYVAILLYNGEKGRQNKWFNYLFYPVHLLVLGMIRYATGL